MQVTALGYVGIQSNKTDEWKAFATEVLGLQLSRHTSGDGSIYFSMDEYPYRLAVHPGDKEGLAYLGFEVKDGTALDQLVQKLEAEGYSPSRASSEQCQNRKVLGLVHCNDPAGNVLELYYGIRRICEPFNSPRGLRGFVTGPLGMGHVVLEVPDLSKCEEFYTNILGFRISDYFENRLVFLHCNQRHHSVALGNFGGESGLRHFMVEVETLDELGTTYDLCQKKGVPIELTLGKHSNDWMYSFYIQSPSGFEVEYGWNGRLVDDATWSVTKIDRPSIWGHQSVGSRRNRVKRIVD